MAKDLLKNHNLVSVSEAAQILGVSIDTIRRWDKVGRLHSQRPNGKDRFFSLEELEKEKFDKGLSISEAAEKLGISQSTLRRLDKKGIITPQRNETGERVYTLKSVHDFLESEYFLRTKEVEDQVLEPIKDASKQITKQSTYSKVTGKIVTETQAQVSKLKDFRNLVFTSAGFAIISTALIIVGMTVMFLLFPEDTARFLGFQAKVQPRPATKIGSSQVLGVSAATAEQSQVVGTLLKPFSNLSLAIVKKISPQAYNRAVPPQIIDADFVQGRQPGISEGDLAVVGKNGTIEGLLLQGATPSAGLTLTDSCSSTQILSWDGTDWVCSNQTGAISSLNSLTGALKIAGSGIASVSTSGLTITITGTEADTLSSVVGRGATTTTAVTFGQLDTTGNVGLGKSLTVTGLTLANGGLNVTGFSNLTGNVGVGGSLTVTSAGVFSSALRVDGSTTLGDASSDTITFTARAASSLIPQTADSYDLGTSALRWNQLYVNGISSTGQQVLTFAPTGTGVNAGTLYLNPASATADYTLLGLAVNGDYRLRVDAEGDLTTMGSVGVGNTAPVQTFQVGTTTSSLVFDTTNTRLGVGSTTPSATAHFVNTSQASSFRVDDQGNDTSPFLIDNGGNVGIANSAPSYTLDVVGTFRQSGNAALGTVTSGTWNGTTIAATYGGTGQSSWTTGDILYASGTNTLSKLGIGSAGQALVVSSGIPSWGTGSQWTTSSNNIYFIGAAGSGNVGIGNTYANYAKLQLTGSGTGTGLTFQTLDSSGTQRFSILDNGNVGIGTTGPDRGLQISLNADPAGTNTSLINTAGTTQLSLTGSGGGGASNWYNTSWKYRKQITITNSGSTLTNYQVLITTDTASLISASKMNTDCSDLRITNSSNTVLSYWVETGTNTCNTSTTAIWVKIPSLPNGDTTVYLYYGNTSASDSQDGTNTFVYFDDFSTNTTANYTVTSGSIAISSGILTVTGVSGTNAVVAPTTQTNPSSYIVEARVAYTNKAGAPDDLAGVLGFQSSVGSANTGYATQYGVISSAQKIDVEKFTLSHNANSAITFSGGTYYLVKGLFTSGTITATFQRTTNATFSDSTYTSGSYGLRTYDADATYDFWFVRVYAATEPSVGSPASEESSSTVKKLVLGIDTTDNYGVIQAGDTSGVNYNLSFNPAGGNVGIGITSPVAKLSVFGNVGIGNTGTGGFAVSAAPANGLAVQGNVGVGTTSPLQALHVVGQCVTGDTLLKRRRRRSRKDSSDLSGSPSYSEFSDYDDVRIDQIQPGDEILTLDEYSGEFVWQQVNNLMDMGIQEVYRLETASGKWIETTGNHPYLVLNIGLLEESNIGEKTGNQNQRKSNLGFNINISEVNLIFHNPDPFLKLKDINTESIPSSMLAVNTRHLGFDFGAFNGTINAAPNQPAERLISRSDNVISQTLSITSILPFIQESGKWTKVSQLKRGQFIVTLGSNGKPQFERILSIKKVGRKPTYDIEVEGTHNFVGNNIVAHNTYISGNLGIGITTPGAGLSLSSNGVIGYSGVNIAGPSNGLAVSGNVGIGITTANSTLSVAGSAHIGGIRQGISAPSNGLFVDGNVGIGATTSSNLLDVWGNSRITGNLTTDGTLTVNGSSTLSSLILNASNAALSFTGTTPSLTSGSALFGIFSGGNVGVGTTGNVYGGLTVRGAGTGTNITLQTYGSNLTQGLTVLDNGNVGVGSTNPGFNLAVVGTGNFGNVGIGGSLVTSGNVGVGGSLTVTSSGVFSSGIKVSAASDLAAISATSITSSGNLTLTGSSANIVLGSNYLSGDGGDEGVFVDSTGNVGIGTAGPAAKLGFPAATTAAGGIDFGGDVNLYRSAANELKTDDRIAINKGPVAYAPGFSIAANYGDTADAWMQFTRTGNGNNNLLDSTVTTNPASSAQASLVVSTARGTIASPTATQNKDYLGMFAFGGYTSTGVWHRAGANIYAVADGDFSGTSTPGKLIFGTTPSGTYDNPTPRLVIDSSGNVGIGATTVNSTLAVVGSAHIGGIRQGISAPSNGLFVDGNVGIGATTSSNLLDVWGNSRITGTLRVDSTGTLGSGLIGYSGVTAPSNGLGVSGNVGVGTTSPLQALHVVGQCVSWDTRLRLRRRRRNSKLKTQKSKLLDDIIEYDYLELMIKEVLPSDEVLSLNEETEEFEYQKVEKLLDMGIKGVYEVTTKSGKKIKTTGNHPYLTHLRGEKMQLHLRGVIAHQSPIKDAGWVKVINLKKGDMIAVADNSAFFGSEQNQTSQKQNNNYKQAIGNSSTGKEVLRIHNDLAFSVNQKLAINPTIPSNKLTVNNFWYASIDETPRRLGATTNTPNQPDVRLIITEDKTSMTVLGGNSIIEPNVSEQDIFVNGFNWDEIASIKYVGLQHVYDLQIANTHNFVGNDIVAHNTYISGNVGIGITTPGAGLSLSSNSVIGYSGVNIAGPSSGLAVSGNVGIGITTANSILTVNGAVAIGSNFNVTAPSNGLIVQGNVGIGMTSPAFPLEVQGGTGGGGVSNLISIKHPNTSTSGDGPALRFNGFYNGAEWQFGRIAVINNGASFGTAMLFYTKPADSVQGGDMAEVWRMTPAGVFQSNGAQTIQTSTGDLTLASVGGNGRIVLSPNGTGNVGIGTATPTDFVQIKKDQNAQTAVRIENANTGTGAYAQIIVANSTAGGDVGGFQALGSGFTSSGMSLQDSINVFASTGMSNGMGIFTQASDSTAALRFGTQSTERMRIDTSGNVGIGTATPGSVLAVIGNVGIGTSAAGARLQVNGGGIFWPLTTSVTGPANGLAVSGNVGIGITTANSILTVNGAVAIGSNFNVTAPSNGLIVQGNVGIGFTSPDRSLQVALDANPAGTNASLINTAGTTQLVLTGSSATGLSKKLSIGIDTTDNYGVIQSGNTSGTNYDLVFNPAGGNVGIGTTDLTVPSPFNAPATLKVEGSATADSYMFFRTGAVTAGYRAAIVFQNQGTGGRIWQMAASNDADGGIGGGKYAIIDSTAGVSADRFIISSSGDVAVGGIGTAAPSARLHVAGSSSTGNGLVVASGNIGFGVTSTTYFIDTSTTSGPNIRLRSTGANSESSVYYQNDARSWGAGLREIGGAGNDFFYIYDIGASADRLVINTSGNVGLAGQTGPDAFLNIASTTDQDLFRVDDNGDGDTSPFIIKSDGNVGIGTATPGSVLSVIGNVGIGTSAAGARLQVNGGGLFGWGTASVAAPSNGLAVFGNVGVGTTSPSAPLEVRGSGTGATIAKFTDENSTGCTLATGGTISCSSDINLKKNIDGLSYGLDDVMKLRPVEFNWKTENDSVLKSLGFIAQEVETVIPKLIITGADGLKELNTIGLVPILTRAIQQQQVQIASHSATLVLQGQTLQGLTISGETQDKLDKIAADQIKEQIASNSAQTINLSYLLSQATASAKLTSKFDTSSEDSIRILTGLKVDKSVEVSLDMTVLGKLTADGGLVITGPAEFKGATIFQALAEFIGNVIFRGDISFEGRPTFNKDTAGFALVKKDADKVEVVFDKEYISTPLVNVSITLDNLVDQKAAASEQLLQEASQSALEKQVLEEDIRYIVTRSTTKGFTIKINKPSATDLKFSWSALAVKDAKTAVNTTFTSEKKSSNTSEVLLGVQTASPSATPSPIPQATPVPITIKINNNELGYLRVRDGATTSSAEVGQVLPGQTFTVLVAKNNWYEIEYKQDFYGWVSGSYVTVQ